jgi:hypothetical protein
MIYYFPIITMSTNTPKGPDVPQEPTVPEKVQNVLSGSPEAMEMPQHNKVWHDLALAFGGYSQVPDRVIGMAIAGQINNNGLKFGPKELDDVVNQICDRWEDQDPNPDEIRQDIIKGMKEEAKEWPKDNDVWIALQSIEG